MSMSIFDIAASGMYAQNIRLNATASNLANADSVSSNDGETYRAKAPIFQTLYDEATGQAGGVRVQGTMDSTSPIRQEYSPGHPMANAQGYIFKPNVNVVEEMANMLSASRNYEMNVEVMTTAKQLMLKTIMLGQ
jgi:flagellar basal-body rod protein FlgC